MNESFRGFTAPKRGVRTPAQVFSGCTAASMQATPRLTNSGGLKVTESQLFEREQSLDCIPNGSKKRNCTFYTGRRETDCPPSRTGSSRNLDEWGAPPDLSLSGASSTSTSLGIPETSELGAPAAPTMGMCTGARNRCTGMNHASSSDTPFLVSLLLNLKFFWRNFQVALGEQTYSHSTTKWLSLCPLKTPRNSVQRSPVPFRASQGTKYQEKELGRVEMGWRNSGEI